MNKENYFKLFSIRGVSVNKKINKGLDMGHISQIFSPTASYKKNGD